MPTTNKRINLSVPDDLYEKIAAYRDENFLPSDAAVCIQLIQQQFRIIENKRKILDFITYADPKDISRMKPKEWSKIQKVLQEDDI